MAVAWLSKHQTLAAALFFILILHLCFFPFIWGNENLLAAGEACPASSRRRLLRRERRPNDLPG